jgi:hypothetical protein
MRIAIRIKVNVDQLVDQGYTPMQACLMRREETIAPSRSFESGHSPK